MKTSKEIRSEFIAFFESKGHRFVPSSSLLPGDDPTLLFANAGMNQFKSVFLGTEKRDYTRAANSQKCIRAGGKHNDLEDVGNDTYHHTFFEMLGNWSFGDYFKADAIVWAWELLTKAWGLPKDRLHVTVFGGDKADSLAADDEAADIWRTKTDIDPKHIHLGSRKDNFWEMGETGPCGPCSEIHIDLTDDKSGGKLVNAGDRRVMEIWNLVFMQFNRTSDGKLHPLPARHVDTGMGLERICAVLQGKKSNYASDLFTPIIAKIEEISGYKYGSSLAAGDRYDTCGGDAKDIACRVIADHCRTLALAIADGIMPSNDGRGYVLRRILRRAARYGRQHLEIKQPFLIKLLPTVISLMADAYPELSQRAAAVEKIILEEEESFGKTLDRGLQIFSKQADAAGTGDKTIHGLAAFELYATYGFPLDLTQLMARERGLAVDEAGFDHEMAKHREVSSAGGGKFKAQAIVGLPATDDSAKYSDATIKAKVLGWVAGEKFIADGALSIGDEAAVALDRTNFYGESGGQVGDAGVLSFSGGRFVVRDTKIAGQCVLHVGVLEHGRLAVGDEVTCEVDDARRDTMRNHTATHLLNWALRRVLGDGVNQAGSVVEPERLRFDFSHGQAVTSEQLAQVEQLVNERILADEVVEVSVMPLEQAKKIPGVRAVFGEKYPDPVRVVRTSPVGGDASLAAIEFCGGVHVSRTGVIGMFKITGEESVAKGVRRIEAVTGAECYKLLAGLDATVKAACDAFRCCREDLADRIAAMQKEIKELKKKSSGASAVGVQTAFASDDGAIVVLNAGQLDAAAMRTLCDQYRQKGAKAVFVGAIDGEKVTLVAMVDQALADGGKLQAGQWVQNVAPVVGGRGGGKPTLAQAGGPNCDKLLDALTAAGEFAKTKLG